MILENSPAAADANLCGGGDAASGGDEAVGGGTDCDADAAIESGETGDSGDTGTGGGAGGGGPSGDASGGDGPGGDGGSAEAPPEVVSGGAGGGNGGNGGGGGPAGGSGDYAGATTDEPAASAVTAGLARASGPRSSGGLRVITLGRPSAFTAGARAGSTGGSIAAAMMPTESHSGGEATVDLNSNPTTGISSGGSGETSGASGGKSMANTSDQSRLAPGFWILAGLLPAFAGARLLRRFFSEERRSSKAISA